MSETLYHFVGIPAAAWSASQQAVGSVHEFQQCIRDARAIEARLRASPDPDNDLRRYAAVCRRVEILAWQVADELSGSHATRIAVGPEYRQMVEGYAASHTTPGRIAATFFAPEEIAQQRRALTDMAAGKATDAIAVLATMEQDRAGLVILTQPYFPATQASQPVPVMPTIPSAMVADAPALPQAVATEPVPPMNRKEARSLTASLRTRMDEAIDRGPDQRVALGMYPDRAITAALRGSVYAPGPASSIVPTFSDGSRGGSFPVRCRVERQVSSAPRTILRVALVSMRHLALDAEVDMAWFRNRDVSRQRRSSETETYCFTTTCDVLATLRREAPLTILLYQTGLAQAIVGFYRGLLAMLEDWSPGELIVIPHFYQPHDERRYVAGQRWL